MTNADGSDVQLVANTEGESERVEGALVSADLVETLGARPLLDSSSRGGRAARVRALRDGVTPPAF
ncbi:MAG: hypothetical protein ACXWLF_05280 [Myxococcaceae bacterium]